jgi:hypothetical protein
MRLPPATSGREGGMNMVETMLVLLTLSILSSMIINSIRRFSSAHAYSEGQARVHEVGDRVIRQVSEDAAFAVHVFTASGDAAGYLAKCDLRGLTPFCPTPPTTTERGYFEKDVAGSPTTGNFLFVGCALDPFLTDLAGDRTDIASVTVYRLLLYLPVTRSGSLDLARWASQKVARLNDVERVSDPVKRTLLLQRLYDAGFRCAWEPGRMVAGGLREISSSGSLSAFSGTDRIAQEPAESRAGMLHGSRMEVARNDSLPNVPVPGFAIANGGFPGGFEVKIDGNASGRMVLVRLVITNKTFDGSRNALAFTRTVANRGSL